MSFDSHSNFSYSTVSTAPSPASSGTSLIVATGDGTKFPAAPFNATVWPAGSQPTTANAEIVRVTAKSTDTFTITRAQESSSARTILVGDQIAATITAKTLTDVETYIDPGVVVVAAPTGTAATDNAAIAAAITAAPTGGIVQLQAGTYAITGLTISKALTLRGHGGANAGEATAVAGGQVWTTWGTRLTLDSATAVAITVSSHAVNLENFALQNVHATAPTAGAGIQTVTGGGNSTHYGPNLSVRGFYINVDHQAGGQWVMDPSCFLLDFVQNGLKIQNVDDTDFGDSVVSGMFYAGPTNNGNYAIEWRSGGGIKCSDIKINVFSGKTLDTGILLFLQDGVSTSDFLICNSSIESSKYGILCEHAGPSNTGQFTNIVISGNQFFTSVTAATTIGIVASAASKVARVNIVGNTLYNTGSGTSYGIEFQDIDNASHGPNVFAGFTNNYKDNGGNTNITSVGNG